MDREIASTAPISQPLQYMMVTTRHTMPAGAGRQLGPGPTHTVLEGAGQMQRVSGEGEEVYGRSLSSGDW